MLNLFDIIDKWIQRLAIRIMRFGGASQANIDKTITNFNAERGTIKPIDEKIKGRGLLYWLIVGGLVAISIFVLVQVKKLFIKKRR